MLRASVFMVKNLLELFISLDALNNKAFPLRKQTVSVFSKSSTQEFCQFLPCLNGQLYGQLRNKCGFFSKKSVI